MSFLSFTDILEPPSTDTSLDRDSTELIGAVPIAPVPATAMRIGPDPATPSRIVYLGEVDVLYVGWVERRDRFGTDRWYRTRRLEIKAESKNENLAAQHSILLSELPYHTSVWAQAPLKPKVNLSKHLKATPPAEILDDPKALAEWLRNEVSYDYWETNNFLTAAVPGFSDPPVFEDKVRNPKKGAGIAIGVCEDAERIYQQLTYHEEWRDLRSQALEGTLRLSPAVDTRFELYDSVKIHVPDIMALALRQAMAGPTDSEAADELVGEPVLKKARWIFIDHANRLNKRANRRQKPSGGMVVFDESYQGSDAHDNPVAEAVIAADSQNEAIDQDQLALSDLMEELDIDLDGALYLVSLIEGQNLAHRYPDMILPAVKLISRVWKRPRPEPNRATCLAYIEQALTAENPPHAFARIAPLIRQSLSRF